VHSVILLTCTLLGPCMLIRNFNGESLYSIVASSAIAYFSPISKSELPFVAVVLLKRRPGCGWQEFQGAASRSYRQRNDN
jgi:hypothetical protein